MSSYIECGLIVIFKLAKFITFSFTEKKYVYIYIFFFAYCYVIEYHLNTPNTCKGS
jgi:hypothetical protein